MMQRGALCWCSCASHLMFSMLDVGFGAERRYRVKKNRQDHKSSLWYKISTSYEKWSNHVNANFDLLKVGPALLVH
jgi:hypothetical protein